MTRRLATTLFTSTLILTLLAVAPARAQQQGEQLGQLFAGALALFAIGSVLADIVDEDDKQKAKANRNNNQNSQGGQSAQSWYWYDDKYKYKYKDKDKYKWHPHGMPPGQAKKYYNRPRTVPMECFFTINNRNRRVGVFGATCLSEFMRYPERLPRACRTSVETRYGRYATVYRADCLREYGWQGEYWRARHRDRD